MSVLRVLKQEVIRKKVAPYDKHLVRTLGSDLWSEVLSSVVWVGDDDNGITLDVEMPDHVRISLTLTEGNIKFSTHESWTTIVSGEDFALQMIDCEARNIQNGG